MALKKDKEKVLDEVWTQERVKSFLDIQTAENVDADFHVLLKAYQSMRLENFEEFVGFFVSAGRNINAHGPDGDTALNIIAQHRNSADYVEILKGHGATAGA